MEVLKGYLLLKMAAVTLSFVSPILRTALDMDLTSTTYTEEKNKINIYISHLLSPDQFCL